MEQTSRDRLHRITPLPPAPPRPALIPSRLPTRRAAQMSPGRLTSCFQETWWGGVLTARENRTRPWLPMPSPLPPVDFILCPSRMGAQLSPGATIPTARPTCQSACPNGKRSRCRRGEFHSLALTAGGSVVAWGSLTYGETNVPSAVTNAMAISAGGWHNLALLSNTTVERMGAYKCGSTIKRDQCFGHCIWHKF